MSAADPWEKAPERFLLCSAYHTVAGLIGWRKAVELGQWVFENKKPRGRTCDKRGILSIPRDPNSRVMQDVAKIVGESAVRTLTRRLRYNVLWFGSIEPASIPRRNRAIVEQLDACGRVALVACVFDLTEREIRRIYLAETGKAFKEPEHRRIERNKRIGVKLARRKRRMIEERAAA